jgi:ABC-type uncharacterized transport system substrate-binding protein
MPDSLKRLTLGLVLIALAAGVLLYADRGSRQSARAKAAGQPDQALRVALVQHASIAVLEEGAAGVIEALAARGYHDGGKISLRKFNAESDLGTANAIAREVAGGSFDLIITLSTPSLQTVATANKSGSRTRHVFGLVTDPYAAGVGIDGTEPGQHPPYLTGFGCLQPVEEAFRMARTLNPGLRSVGLVWNPAESNSLAQTRIARQLCSEMGLTLVEASAENTTGALESANSLFARGIDALWISGDITVSLAAESIIGAARRARIPVFSSLPPKVSQGSLFDLGANYFEVGRTVGALAADVLEGLDPATVPVVNNVPKVFLYNDTVLENLPPGWSIPEAVRQQADGWITATSTKLPSTDTPRAPPAPPKPAAARKWRLDLIEYLETPNVELNREGLLDGLTEAGWQRDRDFELRIRNAQGDMSTLNLMIDAALSEGSDLLLPSTTPALQASLRRAQGRPTVFSLVANPVVAGAGRSDTDHLPFVTGAYLPAPHEEGLAALRLCLPGVTRIGTLFAPSEINSVFYKDHLLEVARKMGLQVEVIGVSTSGEVAEAALALTSRGIQVICQISDNLTGASFASIAQVARRARLPLMGFASAQAEHGAFMTVSRDFHDGGMASARLAVRVLNGESPATIPFQLVEEIRYVFNPKVAADMGVTLPASLLSKGKTVD